MDKETENLLERLGTATDREQDFEKLKLKVAVRLMASIDNLADEIGLLVDNIKNCYASDNKEI